MTAPNYRQADFAAALQALMPRGRAWPRDPDTTQAATLQGLAGVYESSATAAAALLVDAFPATAVALLPEWESTLGLAGTGSTTDRQRAIVAALIDTGGQSAAYYIALAAALGFTVTVDQFSAYTVNSSVAAPIASDEWAHVWRVNAPAAASSAYPVVADVAPAVPGHGNAVLDGAMGALKPAHTVVIMSYA